MSSSEQISEIELLKRRLQAFEEASPDLADKIKQREEELSAQAEEEKKNKISSYIEEAIWEISARVASGHQDLNWHFMGGFKHKGISPCPHGYGGEQSNYQCGRSLEKTSIEKEKFRIKIEEVLQMAFDTIKDNKREINELKAKMEKMEKYMAVNQIDQNEQLTASEETSLDLANSETIPLAKPIDVQIGIPVSKQESFEEDSDEAQMNAAIAAHQRNPIKPKPKISGSRSFMDSNNVLRWRM